MEHFLVDVNIKRPDFFKIRKAFPGIGADRRDGHEAPDPEIGHGESGLGGGDDSVHGEAALALLPGGADRSYGIEVAKLAGLPDQVVQRARKILRQLEEESGKPAAPTVPQSDQVSFTAMGEAEAVDRLRRAQLDTMSPLEALHLLYELKQKLS